MEDLAVDPVSGALLVSRMRAGRRLALLCHAPAAILAAIDEDGANPFAGRKMTGLSNVEEAYTPASAKAKWLLEDRMKETGVEYSVGEAPSPPTSSSTACSTRARTPRPRRASRPGSSRT